MELHWVEIKLLNWMLLVLLFFSFFFWRNNGISTLIDILWNWICVECIYFIIFVIYVLTKYKFMLKYFGLYPLNGLKCFVSLLAPYNILFFWLNNSMVIIRRGGIWILCVSIGNIEKYQLKYKTFDRYNVLIKRVEINRICVNLIWTIY